VGTETLNHNLWYGVAALAFGSHLPSLQARFL
jgi:hypothetical protein